MPNILIPGVIIALIMREPDFGTAVTLGFFGLYNELHSRSEASLSGRSRVGGSSGFYVVVTNFSYMTKRLLIFLDPWADPDGAGFQIVQSFIAFGSGGIWGWG